MSLLVSVDPGLRHCGVAVWLDGVLHSAALVKNPEQTKRGPDAWWPMARAARNWAQSTLLPATAPQWYFCDCYAVELMQVDGRRGRVDDLFQLYGVAMWLGHDLRPNTIAGYYPRVWKKSVPKEVMANRTFERLTEKEKGAIVKCAPSLRHNVIDAVSIGLFHLGRL